MCTPKFIAIGILFLAATIVACESALPAPTAPFYQFYTDQPDVACAMLNFSATFTAVYIDKYNKDRTRVIEISSANTIAMPNDGSCNETWDTPFLANFMITRMTTEPDVNTTFWFLTNPKNKTQPHNWTLDNIQTRFTPNDITFPDLAPKYWGGGYAFGWDVSHMFSTALQTSYACNFDANRKNNSAINKCSQFQVDDIHEEVPWLRSLALELHSIQTQGLMLEQDGNVFGTLGEECICNNADKNAQHQPVVTFFKY